MELDEMRRCVDRGKAQRSMLIKQLRTENDALSKATAKSDAIHKSRALIQEAALQTQQHLQVQMSTLVTSALDAVFPDKKLTFRIQFEPKRGRTECLLEVGENGVYSSPMETHGGGVIDVISFALRMSFWSMQRTRAVFILDEPMKFLSAGLIPLAAEMLRAMSDKLGIQIIMVSHIEEFAKIADNVIMVERSNGISSTKQGIGAGG